MVYKDMSNSYKVMDEDHDLVREILNPWELNSFVTLVQLNLKNQGLIK